ncbi:MAG: RNA pseudouridine synthase [Magnetococcus sp. WYHC-3]
MAVVTEGEDAGTAGYWEGRVLYRDADMLVLDKPNRLPLYRGPGGGAVLADILGLLRFGLCEDPVPAHRLDAATSGCLVLGRHRRARQRLGAWFASGAVGKRYQAVVCGSPPQPQGSISAPVLDRGWRGRPRMVVQWNGRTASTRYACLHQGPGWTRLLLEPEEGRTHQLRVHCAWLGMAILGDPLYGPPGRTDLPLHLHACAVTLPLESGALTICAPLPEHLRMPVGVSG